MSRRLSLTVVFESVENNWVQARIEEIPAVITAAATRDEARELLQDALREYLLSLGESEVSMDSDASTESLEIQIGV
ncbi:MAG: type II toxin-antitoxin system HicB family antitoxin [Actinomycetota bacterium]